MKDGFKHKRKPLINKKKLEDIKDKIIESLYIIVIISVIILMVIILGIRTYIMIKYADVPISELPAWAYWWMQDGGG